MKAKDAMLAWNPCWLPDKFNDGKAVEVRPMLPDDWADRYRCTTLAPWVHFRTGTKSHRQRVILVEALHLIIRDRVDPRALHDQLMKIDEYREMMAEDMPGMDR